MAKLTTQLLVSWLHGKKSVEDLLKTTRSTIDSIEQLVDEKLNGEVKEEWKKKISEYKNKNTQDGAGENVVFSDEDAYLLAKRELESVEEDLLKKEQEKEMLQKKIEVLNSESDKLKERKLDLKDKIAELEQKLVVNLVYDESQISKFDLKFYTIVDENMNVDEDKVGEVFGRHLKYFPKTMSIQDAIVIIKSILFIEDIKESGRIVKIYAPTEIIKLLEECNIFNDNDEIEKFVTN